MIFLKLIKYYFILSTVALLFSCTIEKENNSNNYFKSKFIGTGYEGSSISQSSNERPYVPQIKIQDDKIIYVAPDSLGNGLTEILPTSFQDAINKADSDYTIIALDGVYRVKVMVDTLKNVTIISKNKWGAKIIPKGTRSDEAAFVFYSRE